MSFLRTLLALAAITAVTACTVTGPADDGWENQQESVDNGSITGGGFVILGGDEEKARKKTESRDSNPDISYDTEAPTDYQSYKQWREARERDSIEYQKFKQWQDFEEYRRWKESQGR